MHAFISKPLILLFLPMQQRYTVAQRCISSIRSRLYRFPNFCACCCDCRILSGQGNTDLLIIANPQACLASAHCPMLCIDTSARPLAAQPSSMHSCIQRVSVFSLLSIPWGITDSKLLYPFNEPHLAFNFTPIKPTHTGHGC